MYKSHCSTRKYRRRKGFPPEKPQLNKEQKEALEKRPARLLFPMSLDPPSTNGPSFEERKKRRLLEANDLFSYFALLLVLFTSKHSPFGMQPLMRPSFRAPVRHANARNNGWNSI